MRQGESIDGSQATAGHAESTDVDAESLGRQFGRLFDEVIETALAGLFSSVAEIGLGFSELRILRTLSASSPDTDGRQSLAQTELAATTGMSPTAVRAAVSTLESCDLIVATDETAWLTEGGHEVLRDLRNKRQQALASFVQSLSRSERLRLAGALHLLDARFDQRLQS